MNYADFLKMIDELGKLEEWANKALEGLRGDPFMQEKTDCVRFIRAHAILLKDQMELFCRLMMIINELKPTDTL